MSRADALFAYLSPNNLPPMRFIILGLMTALLNISASAQEKASTFPSPEHYAHLRTQAYVAALGLSEQQISEMNALFLVGEKEVVQFRAACREAQQQVDAAMKANDAKAEGLLTEEQRAKLMKLRMTADFDTEVPSCLPARYNDGHFGRTCCAIAKMKTAPDPVLLHEDVPEMSSPK